MPGIFDAENPSNDQSEAVATSSTSEATNEMQSEPEEAPVREITQTDRVNKFLLRSFLEHINANPINVSNESDQQGSDAGNSDWS